MSNAGGSQSASGETVQFRIKICGAIDAVNVGTRRDVLGMVVEPTDKELFQLGTPTGFKVSSPD